MTFYHVTTLINQTNEDDHFLELMNICINPKPIDPKEREEAVYPYLDELRKVLEKEIQGKKTLDELKKVIHDWIDEKKAQGPSDPGSQ